MCVGKVLLCLRTELYMYTSAHNRVFPGPGPPSPVVRLKTSNCHFMHILGFTCCRKDAVRFATCVRHTRRALDGLRAGAAWFDMLLYILRTAAGELGVSPLHRPALTTPSHCILPTAHATQRDRVGRAVVAGQGDCGTQPYPEPIQPIQPERPQLSCSASQRLHTLRLSSGTSTRPHAHCEPQRDARGTPAGLGS